MDLTQSKLSRSEWNSIETPVSENEIAILKLIANGFQNTNIRHNEHKTLIQIMKLEKTHHIENYLYHLYFQEQIQGLVKKYAESTSISFTSPNIDQKQLKSMKKADIIRIENMKIDVQKPYIFEYTLLSFCENMMTQMMVFEPSYRAPAPIKTKKNAPPKSMATPESFSYYLYSLLHFKKQSITECNPHVATFIDQVIQHAKQYASVRGIIHDAFQVIENNKYLLEYEDTTLYSHQKQLFSILKQNTKPKLLLYTAPTGTGKTLSPIGLLENYKVVFVCVARHVGLALAKSAISVGKRIAFAFGCETASDIRLHYFAAKDYVKNSRSGAIAKVDNSIGDKVEMIICDVKSYLIAMQYMKAFNRMPTDEDIENGAEIRKNNDIEIKEIITYWDEPTITMDYESHELHETIHRNWVENEIPVVILSCATLPKEDEIVDSVMDFRAKFEDAEIYTIESYDCKKSISMLNVGGKTVLPHTLFENYDDVRKCVEHCISNKSLLRYFDLGEIVRFIEYVHDHDALTRHPMDTYFEGDIMKVTMHSLKIYYLELLNHIKSEMWPLIYRGLVTDRDAIKKTTSMDQPSSVFGGGSIVRSQSVSSTMPPVAHPLNAAHRGILLTTSDAHTLTDGPTIYLAEDPLKIGAFLIQQAMIPDQVLFTIMEKIEKNNQLQNKLDALDNDLQDKLGKEIEKTKKMEKEQFNGETRAVLNQINSLRGQIQVVAMDKVYVPNTQPHQRLWTNSETMNHRAFIPLITENVVKQIMACNVSTQMKMLLLLGIGTFQRDADIQYMEIMKELAHAQKLFIIIAGSDYIYGTNYQFCHGFVGKDLMNMTQQKIIQAMGRIGRNNIQQDYSVRFRDDGMISHLFMPPEKNLEAEVMGRLFNS
jgi:hypothetical protein